MKGHKSRDKYCDTNQLRNPDSGFCKKCEAFTLDELAAFCVALRIPMSKHDSKEMLCKRIFTKLSPEERNAFNSIYQALQNGSAPPTASTPMTSSPPLTRQRQQEQVASTVAPFLFTEVPKRLVQQQARNKRYHPVIIGDANRPFPPASMPYFIAKTADSPSYPVEEAKDMLLANLEKMYEKLAPFVNLGFMSNGEFKTVKVTFLRSLFEKANADDLQRGIAMHFKSNDGTIRGLVNFRLVEAVAPPAPVKVKAAPPVVNEEDKLMAEILGRVVLADKVAAKKKEQKPVARLQKGQHKPGPLPKAEYPFWTNVNVISDGTGRVVITHENEPFETLTGVTAIYTEAYTDEKNEKRRGIVIQQSGDRVVYVGWFEPSHFDVYHFNLVPGEEVKALFYNPKPQSAFEKDDPNSESKYLEIPALFGQTHVYFPTYGTFITIQDWTTKYIVDRDNIRKLARLAQPVTITKRNNPRI